MVYLNGHSNLGYIRRINEQIWQLRQTKLKYENYQTVLESHIEQIRKLITLEIDFESLELLQQYITDRSKELEMLKIELKHRTTPIKLYKIVESKYNIFG